MLVLHSDCSKPKSLLNPLRKKLCKIIENETIKVFANFLGVQIKTENACKSQKSRNPLSKGGPRKNQNQNQNNEADETKNPVSKVSMKRKGADQSLGEKSKKPRKETETEPLPITFETQKAIAEELYYRIKAKVKQHSKIDLEERFDNFKFLILLPNRCSIEDQTILRIKEKFLKKDNPEKNVLRILESSTESKNQKKWNLFLQEAKHNDKTFFLVIHDECHWAAGTDNTFKFLGFDKGDYHYPDGQLLPNLFTLMVSATPYNFFPHLNQEDILFWNKHLEEVQHNHPNVDLKNTYQGLTHFIGEESVNCKMLTNSSDQKVNWWKKHQFSFEALEFNGFTKDFILLLLDYTTAISDVNQIRTQRKSFPVTEELKECVKACINEKKQIIVRLPGASNEIRQTEVAEKVLQHFCKKEIAITVFTSAQKEEQHSNLFLDSKSKIILIIDNFRMGETFPKSCICFDVRARYLSTVRDFTAIIQDVGRAFGYSKRPLLLLSQQAYDFLSVIWDVNTGYISWESLQTKLKSVLLGPNTIRKPQMTTNQINNEMYANVPQEDGSLCPQDGSLFPEDGILPQEDGLTEDDRTEITDIQQFQEIFESDSKDPVFLFKLKLKGNHPAFAHRIFLKAEPQIGKTGAFLHLAFLLEDKLCQGSFFLRQNTEEKYVGNSLEDIETSIGKREEREKHKKYLRVLGRARENRKQNGIVEPSRWAALCLIKNLLENCQQKQAEIQVADFGCGDMQFAKFLCEELQKKPELAATRICVHAYDISPNEILISHQLENSKQIRIVSCPGISCGKLSEFQAESFDYIVSTLALFGNEDSWKKTIQTAFYALKTNGKFILAEWKKYLPSSIAQNLATVGIDCRHIVPGILLK
jgi:hypothetical protein